MKRAQKEERKQLKIKDKKRKKNEAKVRSGRWPSTEDDVAVLAGGPT